MYIDAAHTHDGKVHVAMLQACPAGGRSEEFAGHTLDIEVAERLIRSISAAIEKARPLALDKLKSRLETALSRRDALAKEVDDLSAEIRKLEGELLAETGLQKAITEADYPRNQPFYDPKTWIPPWHST